MIFLRRRRRKSLPCRSKWLQIIISMKIIMIIDFMWLFETFSDLHRDFHNPDFHWGILKYINNNVTHMLGYFIY